MRKRAATLQRGVTFDDVAGIGEAMDEPPEIIDAFLRVPTATYPRWTNAHGVLSLRPPVTGNALLAFAGAGSGIVRVLFDRASPGEPHSLERSTTVPSCRF